LHRSLQETTELPLYDYHKSYRDSGVFGYS
jgi:hypothetical protein